MGDNHQELKDVYRTKYIKYVGNVSFGHPATALDRHR